MQKTILNPSRYTRIILLFIVFALSVCWSNAHGQNPVMEDMVRNLEDQMRGLGQTKVYVHTDKPFYSEGDTIWYALYAVNARDHDLVAASLNFYVTLEDEDGNLLTKQNLRLDYKNASGEIALDDDWPSGNYTLKAFSSYMLNFDQNLIFAKELKIYSDKNTSEASQTSTTNPQLNVRFFPEGGSLINGINSKVAFEITGIQVEEIEVFSSDGSSVSKGKVLENNLGVFNLIPQKEEQYYVQLDGKRFSLPQVKASGYSITVNTLNKDKIFIDAVCSEDRDLEGTFIIGHLRGKVFLMQDNLEGKKQSLVLGRSSMPEGVSQVTLFDKDGNPLTERTFFIRYTEEILDVEASIPYEYLNKRQKAEVNVDISSAELDSISGIYSVSVVDAYRVKGLREGVDIRSYLLLGSEFTDEIDNIHQYFADNSTKSRFLIDVLMMTRGWTRFKWEEIKEDRKPEIKHFIENGFTISGQVYERDEPVQAVLNFSRVRDNVASFNLETDENGRFEAFGFDLKKDDRVVISAYKKGKKEKLVSKNISLELDLHEVGKVESTNVNRYEGPGREELIAYINTANEARMLDSIYDGMQINLDEVVMTADRGASLDRKLKKERGIIYTNYDSRVFMDSMPGRRIFTNVFDMVQGQVPGVRVNGPRGNQRFILRNGSSSLKGSSDALVIVDGTPVSYEYVNAIDPNQIEFVDILRGISTSSLYGTPNGVVAFYTRTENQEVSVSKTVGDNVKSILHEGYHEAREFYSPNYSKAFPGDEKKDLRTTIYWSPKVLFENGSSQFEFYTADVASEYLIEIQGITERGIPFVNYSTFEVR